MGAFRELKQSTHGDDDVAWILVWQMLLRLLTKLSVGFKLEKENGFVMIKQNHESNHICGSVIIRMKYCDFHVVMHHMPNLRRLRKDYATSCKL